MWIASFHSQWQRGKGVVNSFSFLFFIFFILVYVIDCEFFLFFIKEEISSGCGLLRFTRNDSTHKLVIARAWKARGNLGIRYNYSFIEFFFFSVFALTFCDLWIASFHSQWQYIQTRHCESQPTLVIARAWKARGNLSIRYNYSFIEFFYFSVFALTFCGLWIASSFYSSQWQYTQTRHCESCLQLVAISVYGIIILLMNFFLFCFYIYC